MNAPPTTGVLLDGRYLLGPVIARGGMSVVHRGVDTRLDRPVAVKVMEPRLAADPAFRTRVEREARTAARIDHPAVVDVYDHGIDHRIDPDGPLVFLVMELVDGGTLRDVIRARGGLGVPAAFAVMDGVLSGLAEAHRLGMVHRDVKPENVLISSAGELKVADFGLVTAAAQAGQSHAGMIMGTAAYLSPEQVATGAADSRSDVYAAGVLLYELLTGAPPYSGDTALSVAYRHVNSDVPPPSMIAGDVPPELDDLVVRATRRDPAARPVDAAAMLAELRGLAVALEVPRVPVPPPPPRPVEEQTTVPQAPMAGRSGTRAMPRSPQGHTMFGEPADEPPKHLRARRRSRQVFAVWIAIVLVIALVLGLGAWWLGSGRWTAMPSLVGLDRPAAERALADADLVATVTTAYDDGIAAGVVTATDPAPEARLLRGSTVGVKVSSGRPTVPDIQPGTTVTDAELAVRSAGLQPVQSTAARDYSDTAPEGTVVRTQPGAGTALAVGGPVTLVLSSGPQPKQVRVPLLTGLTYDEAKAELAERGLEAEESERLPLGLGGHNVIGQNPKAGTEVEPGTTVTLATI